MEDMRLYPDPTGRKLKVKMAELYEVQPENVFLSNGSDDILNFAFMAWNDTNDSIVIPDVTYSFYEVVARLHEINYEIKPLRDDLTLDLEGYIGIDKNIVLPNPNAPTGIALSRTQIEELVRSNPDNVVIIDEVEELCRRKAWFCGRRCCSNRRSDQDAVFDKSLCSQRYVTYSGRGGS